MLEASINGSNRCILPRKSLDGFEIISNRKVHLKKNFENISLTIFEGGHEMLIDSAFLDFL